MSSLQIGRLIIGPPLAGFTEPLGDPVQGQGGAVVSAPRTPPQYQIPVPTIAADGQSDSLASRLRIRRQLRGMLNNTPLKFGAFLYILWADDLEQDGWYVPDQSSLTEIADGAGLASGFWQMASSNWYLAGRPRTHREARQVWMKDLRTGLYPRDALGWIYSTDYSALAAVPLTILANGANQAADSVTGGVVSGPPLNTGRDGGTCQLIEGLTDLSVISYERPESALLLSDVIVYDRRGTLNAPATGPGGTWEEAYGPDHAWSWVLANGTPDAPVLDNGLIRVRYDNSAGDPGLRIDVWTGSAYVEQGKVTIYRIGDASGYCSAWISASLIEYTPERAVVSLVLQNTFDAYSRERVFITVQRGETQATIECYPAPTSTGAAAQARIVYTPAGPDSNDSLLFEPATSTPAAGTDQIWSTASSTWTTAAGAFSATTANFLSILRCVGGAATVGAYQVNMVVVQQAAVFAAGSDSSAYGTAMNAVWLTCNAGVGYLQAQIGFTPTVAKQVQAAGGSWTAGQASQYRVFGLKSSTWTDYGEYYSAAINTGTSTRVEAHLTQDRTRTAAKWNGVRDAGQAGLFDSRQIGALVAR